MIQETEFSILMQMDATYLQAILEVEVWVL